MGLLRHPSLFTCTIQTFSVGDPYSSHGADESNLSMNQILAAGFTPDKVLIYDYTFRRDPVDPLMAYPPDILKIHQEFTAELRMKMAAVVDVVWGAPVRERMKTTLSLEELPLWGEYEAASIHLEWEKSSRKLQKSVIFVRHPEAMMYSEPSIVGKLPDLSLQAAPKLAKMDIAQHFYEKIHLSSGHEFLSGESRTRRTRLNEEARAQLENIGNRLRSASRNVRQMPPISFVSIALR
ncbi:uncharacterized protein BBA_08475 [Beauveria bassiana ARSEF 2860]|uniref:Uncharacterized protein n=1 Tax=Beauveria bassiana (strain ARSEF 2860) TaxID=655819 RepID=J4KLP5_BEAB2|nr:uncharacterized protein BBA_08475 [Beauveria bassiana ARSEF 2860]EJP62564.1 hypothetical protein BBA_08475 [Beauveria bassiana ARSEF 2860]